MLENSLKMGVKQNRILSHQLYQFTFSAMTCIKEGLSLLCLQNALKMKNQCTVANENQHLVVV